MDNEEQKPIKTVDDPDKDPKIPESPKPMAFTVDFGDGKTVDTQRHKTLVEKFQKKHRRGQSLSKIDEPATTGPNQLKPNKHPLTGNLPRRKSSFQSEGYFSSDEKSERAKTKITNNNKPRAELSLPLKNSFSDKMSQSFPNSSCLFNNMETPEIELKDVSSPELDLISPFSPKTTQKELPPVTAPTVNIEKRQQHSSPINQQDIVEFIEGTEFDFDKKSDTVSDAGTYTLDADNYSEEQKARMSIDAEFKIEQVSVMKKTEDYIKSLYSYKEETENITRNVQEITITETKLENNIQSPRLANKFNHRPPPGFTTNKMLSPILSPTQNLSITDNPTNNNDSLNKTYTRIMFPSPKARGNGLEQLVDQGNVISVTSSGAFRSKAEKEKNVRKLSLTQSEIHVEAYVGDKVETDIHKSRKLTANIINVQSISVQNNESNGITDSNLKISNLPPAIGGISSSGKISPTKIPSPIHTISRPRSRSSISSLNVDLSDSSLETESYLKPTQNCINSLQQKLSIDNSSDDHDDDDNNSDFDKKSYTVVQLNNSAHNLLLLKQKATHIRHNSLDDKISNKLEHFQTKNFHGIDQTSVFNQYNQKVMHKIQNSPNNSPIRRSSSFTTKNQINLAPKNTNISKESNLKHSPNLSRNSSIQRSASTANIKPAYLLLRRSSMNSDHQKIDRNQFGDTESSSEEDFEKNLVKKKDLSGLTNTRYNRAFSLRRGRLDEPSAATTAAAISKCPNTPEMRRKFQPEIRAERAISVDRKPVKTNEVQSRYLLNISKKSTSTPSPIKNEIITTATPTTKYVPKSVIGVGSNSGGGGKLVPSAATPTKSQVFSRTDSGRFSTRAGKPPTSGGQKGPKKDQGKKSSGRSNSSLSSREKEFQNWKRRKSYDPMKAAAEGKRKELAKRQNIMTQSYTEANQNQDCDSSPSHSSSVHRSQSFHGTAALEQLISSEEEEDLTLSADEGFSPPTPSPCELSPARASLRNAWKDHILH